MVFGWNYGIFSLVFGTHAHAQIADEKILPNWPAYITDLGTCGSYESVFSYEIQGVVFSIIKINHNCLK